MSDLSEKIQEPLLEKNSNWKHEPDIVCPICKTPRVYSTTFANRQYLSYETLYECIRGHGWNTSREVG